MDEQGQRGMLTLAPALCYQSLVTPCNLQISILSQTRNPELVRRILIQVLIQLGLKFPFGTSVSGLPVWRL